MTGVLYGRAPDAENTDPIHLWEREGEAMVTSCGEHEAAIIDQSSSSVLIKGESGTKKELLVIQQESFKRGNSGYCSTCLAEHPKASKFAG